MDIVEAIKTRKSIRGYKSDPVPESVLKEILAIATRSPSATNTQPWKVTVVSGEALDGIKKGNLELYTAGKIPERRRLEGVYRERQVELGIQLFNLMGIGRDDREKREDWVRRGLRFFEAPAVIYLSVESSLGEHYSNFDCGALAQTICLTALNYGLGTCIMGQGMNFPDVVRKFTSIPEPERLVISIAIGYPDWDFPANRLESRREPVEVVARFVSRV
ncbi:MAG: nitroreductase [Chloroflexota bacterium]